MLSKYICSCRVDVVVASDIVFAKELHPALAGVLASLLERNTCPAYLACTRRQQEGMVQGFLDVSLQLGTVAIMLLHRQEITDNKKDHVLFWTMGGLV
jgi:hypothetical protein